MVLLITGCINPIKKQEWLQISNDKVRLQQYIDSIKYYIKYSCFDEIVFCENSNYQCDERYELEKLAGSIGKKLEWLSFSGNCEIVKLWGKGAGEDEIVSFAIKNSATLKQADCFAKVTGRLILKNINSIVKKCKKNNNYFIRDVYRDKNRFGVDTRFYIIEKSFFENNLMNCYRTIKKEKSVPLEEIYYSLLKGSYCCFREYPRFEGCSAGNGRDYGKEPFFQYVYFDFFARLGLFNIFFNIVFLIVRLRCKIMKKNGKK